MSKYERAFYVWFTTWLTSAVSFSLPTETLIKISTVDYKLWLFICVIMILVGTLIITGLEAWQLRK